MLKICSRCNEPFKNTYKGGLCFGCVTELKNNNELDTWVNTRKAHHELVAEHFTPEDPFNKRRRMGMELVSMGVAAQVSRQEIQSTCQRLGYGYKNLPMASAYKSVGKERSHAYQTKHPNLAQRKTAGGTP